MQDSVETPLENDTKDAHSGAKALPLQSSIVQGHNPRLDMHGLPLHRELCGSSILGDPYTCFVAQGRKREHRPVWMMVRQARARGLFPSS